MNEPTKETTTLHSDNDPQLSPKPEPHSPADRPLPGAVRNWWDTAWSEGGILHDRWEDLRQAPELGWHGMSNWVKTLIAAVALAAIVLLLDDAGTVLLHDLGRLLAAAPQIKVGTDTSTGVWAVIDHPARTYIATHSAGLPISASTVYTLWLFTGGACLVLGFTTRSNGVRLTWAAWGTASIAMVWTASPASGRTIAASIAVLAWTAASAFALRGLNLRPRVFAHIHNAAPEIRPTITIPAPTPPGDTPDNVRPLNKR